MGNFAVLVIAVCAAVTVAACKRSDPYSFQLADDIAAAPPPSGAAKLSPSGIALQGICTNKKINGNRYQLCYEGPGQTNLYEVKDVDGNIVPKEKWSSLGITTNSSADSPVVPIQPLPNSEKWFVADQTSYYQPLPDSTVWQHFDKSGKATGYYFDKTKNQMVKPVNGKFDPKKGFEFGTEDQIYSMSQTEYGGWKGEQQYLGEDNNLQSAGFTFYQGYVKPSANGQQPSWGYAYELDTEKYNQYNRDPVGLKYLAEQKKSGRVFLDTWPPNSTAQQKINFYDDKAFSSLWIPRQTAVQQRQVTPNINRGNVVQGFRQPGTTSGSTQRGQYTLYSMDGCGPCEALKATIRQRGITNINMIQLTRDQAAQRGGSYPQWETPPGPHPGVY